MGKMKKTKAEKKKSNIKDMRVLPLWGKLVLSTTQHICACIIVVSIIQIITSTIIQVNSNIYGEYFVYANLFESSDALWYEDAYSEHVQQEYDTIIKYVAIRNLLETDGTLDLSKEINIVEFYNRKYKDSYSISLVDQPVYTLGDLIRWSQYGGVSMLENGSIINEFKTVEGKNIEDYVTTAMTSNILVEELQNVMDDLQYNYQEYLKYRAIYDKDTSNVMYYITLNDSKNTCFTNMDTLNNYTNTSLRNTFSEMDYYISYTQDTLSATGTLESISTDDLISSLLKYDYIYDMGTNIWLGIDTSRGGDDFYTSIKEGYENIDRTVLTVAYFVMILSFVYYLIVMTYITVTEGKKKIHSKVEGESSELYIETKLIDHVYTELYLAWTIILGYALVMIFTTLTNISSADTQNLDFQAFVYEGQFLTPSIIMMLLGTFVASALLCETWYGLARRVRAKNLITQSIIYLYGYQTIAKLIRNLIAYTHVLSLKLQFVISHSTTFIKSVGVFFAYTTFIIFTAFLCGIAIISGNFIFLFVIGLVAVVTILMVARKRFKYALEKVTFVQELHKIAKGEESILKSDEFMPENAEIAAAMYEVRGGILTAIEKSRRDERLKAELLTNVSHDIKTPLTSIISYVDLLKKEELQNEAAQGYLEIIDAKSQKLKSLILDLVEISKITTGNIEYEMMSINFHELMQQAISEYGDKFEEKCLQLLYHNETKDAMIQADPRRMWRVMENVFSNIYKYALEGTRVYVDVSEYDGKLELNLKNISAKELHISVDELTERFVRGDESRTTEGSGLGLSIAKSLVEGQGGTFNIQIDGDLFKVVLIFEKI
ncbi:MAG: HAMP domain-containing sensor histidine kinase [Lachnospiraceae bacterium]